MSAATRALAALVALVAVARAAEYFVLPQDAGAADTNVGTQARPFSTLGKACQVAAPGDTVFLGEGTYRETLRPQQSGSALAPIRFAALPQQRVTLSGAEPLAGAWRLHNGSIYTLQTPLRFIQLFVDGRMMLEARWPNSSFTDLMQMKRAAAGPGTDYETLADANLPPGDWNGAVAILWPGSEWVNTTRRVTDYQPGTSFRFDRDCRAAKADPYHAEDPYQPRAGNPYLLVGSLAGLDSPGEWFLDAASGALYLWTPNGDSPAQHRVEVKQRDDACDLSKRGFVEVKGMEIFAGAVNMTDAQNCLLDDCRLRYVEHVREYEGGKLPPVRNTVTGKNNEWRRCLVAYGATSALLLAGENNGLVNCVVHDANYLGSGRGGLDLARSVGARVQHCSGDGLHINSDALNHLIYNNTIMQVKRPFGTYCYAKYTPTMKGMRILNNLVNGRVQRLDPTELVQGELGPEYHHNGPGAVDQDAYPVAGSLAIDAGVPIPGITDGFQGAAPDLGAYEAGGPRWTAGADWQDPEAAAAPARNLAYSPRGPVDAANMISVGLVLWLDGADAATVQVGDAGLVQAWQDKSPQRRVARPVDPACSVKWVAAGLNGKSVMRGNGTGSLRVSGLKRGPGPLTMLLVSQAPDAAGPSWQRLISCFTGEGQEWVLPNWMIGRAGGATPQAYLAQLFSIQQLHRAALDELTVLGATAAAGQYLAGDVAEVLVFDRLLRFDEAEAIQRYLQGKWGLKE